MTNWVSENQYRAGVSDRPLLRVTALSSSTRAVSLVRLVRGDLRGRCSYRRHGHLPRVLLVATRSRACGQATQSNFFEHPSSANLEAWPNPKTGSFDRPQPPETLWALG